MEGYSDSDSEDDGPTLRRFSLFSLASWLRSAPMGTQQGYTHTHGGRGMHRGSGWGSGRGKTPYRRTLLAFAMFLSVCIFTLGLKIGLNYTHYFQQPTWLGAGSNTHTHTSNWIDRDDRIHRNLAAAATDDHATAADDHATDDLATDDHGGGHPGKGKDHIPTLPLPLSPGPPSIY
jgi:hypothetical protein